MRIPDLEDLVRDQERAIRRREQGTDLLGAWCGVLAWLHTVEDLPIMRDWVEAAFNRYAPGGDGVARQKAMWARLNEQYPRSEMIGEGSLRGYNYRRLVEVVEEFIVLAGRPV